MHARLPQKAGYMQFSIALILLGDRTLAHHFIIDMAVFACALIAAIRIVALDFEHLRNWGRLAGNRHKCDHLTSDVIGDNFIVAVFPNITSFTVSPVEDRYTLAETIGIKPQLMSGKKTPRYVWSKKSKHYHYPTCRFVRNITPENLVQGDYSPAGKRLHKGCPK